MLSRTALSARTVSRAAVAPSSQLRAFSATAFRPTTHPSHGGSSGNSVGEDVADTQGKNMAYPFFMVAGAGAVGYLLYSNFYSGKAERQEKANAPHDMRKENPPAGSKPLTGARG
ncbi:hypothetical protein JCM6882_003090 [Rhodosporidiobolus microsporus]